MTGTSRNAIVAIDANGFSFSNIDMSEKRLTHGLLETYLSLAQSTIQQVPNPIDIEHHNSSLSNALTGQFSTFRSYSGLGLGCHFGSGTYHIDNSWIESIDTALVTSGTGTLSISDHYTSEMNGLSFSGISSTSLDNVTVNISSGGDIGIDILQGHHEFSNLAINMPPTNLVLMVQE